MLARSLQPRLESLEGVFREMPSLTLLLVQKAELTRRPPKSKPLQGQQLAGELEAVQRGRAAAELHAAQLLDQAHRWAWHGQEQRVRFQAGQGLQACCLGGGSSRWFLAAAKAQKEAALIAAARARAARRTLQPHAASTKAPRPRGRAAT